MTRDVHTDTGITVREGAIVIGTNEEIFLLQ